MTARLRELYRYHELLENLVVRDLKVRYKNSVLGFLWSLVNPLLLMIVFTVVFTVMLPNVTIVNFPVFALTALLPWNFFSASVMSATNSIVQNSHLVKKVYFPREILPISTVLSNFVNFLLALPVLFLFILLFRVPLTVWLIYLPLIMVVQIAFTIGVALVLATLNVFYRDTAVIMEVIMQAWFFLTPVFYPADVLPATKLIWGLEVPVRRLVYILNPMASIIASYRSVLYGFVDGSPPTAPGLDFFSRTIVTALLCLVFGYLVFTRYSHRFGEEV
ncbi:MAG: ABC transporter permease [Chloroflexi bacterium]|jgi:lipopolysaccharide transport system permease protein|nr:ABC transporter permease [Chloroflexota bacterium]